MNKHIICKTDTLEVSWEPHFHELLEAYFGRVILSPEQFNRLLEDTVILIKKNNYFPSNKPHCFNYSKQIPIIYPFDEIEFLPPFTKFNEAMHKLSIAQEENWSLSTIKERIEDNTNIIVHFFDGDSIVQGVLITEIESANTRQQQILILFFNLGFDFLDVS